MKRLDEIVFEKQRLGFRTRHGGFEPCDLAHHEADARRQIRLLKVGAHALFEVARLPDVEAASLRVVIAVASRQIRERPQFRLGVEGLDFGFVGKPFSRLIFRSVGSGAGGLGRFDFLFVGLSHALLE